MKTTEEVVELLNEMLAADPIGMAKIFMHRIPVSEIHTPHDDVVTAPIGGILHYGALGVINALLDEQIIMLCHRDDPLLVPRFFYTQKGLDEFQTASQQCCRDNPEGNACGDDCTPREPLDESTDNRIG